jgi:hypothetical protein
MGVLRKSALAFMILLTASVGMAFGQILKEVDFDVNVPFTMRMADYLIPAGHYVIYQVDGNNPNLFYLYKDDMTHSPIATIMTVRHDFVPPYFAKHTDMRVRLEETSTQGTVPVLRGWNIAGEDGWTIISVVPKRGSMLTRVD